MVIAVLGMDLGKTICTVAGLNEWDTEAIAEAATCPTMSFVTVKSEEELDLHALHRVRERLGTIGPV